MITLSRALSEYARPHKSPEEMIMLKNRIEAWQYRAQVYSKVSLYLRVQFLAFEILEEILWNVETTGNAAWIDLLDYLQPGENVNVLSGRKTDN